MKELTPKQKRFCQEYIIDFNGTQAAIRAGYSKKTAKELASQLLTKLNIQTEIQGLANIITDKALVTTEEIVREYKKLAFTDSADLFDFKVEMVSVINDDGEVEEKPVTKPFLKDYKDIPPEALAAISEIRETNQGIAIKLHSKQAALDSLSKYQGIFTDKHEITGKDGGPIETQYNINFIPVKKKCQK
jgi:phage terminase small subunit